MKPRPSNINRKRGFTKFLSPKFLTALDMCKISDYDAIHTIISTNEALGKNVTKLIINRTIQQDFSKKESKRTSKNV